MYVIKEPLVEEQVVCWNCEEMVHESALQCPYCNVDLHKHALQKVSSPTPKITPITQYAASQDAVSSQQELQGSNSTFSFVASLFLFLSGSAFLLLAAMVFFFSENGTFIICWPKHMASAFLGLGMAAVAFGTIFFQNVFGRPEE